MWFNSAFHDNLYLPNERRTEPMLSINLIRIKIIAALLIVCAGCAAIAKIDMNNLYGTAAPINRATNITQQQTTPAQPVEFFQHQVNPILESRCVVCHACYDAPCQLKMTSSQGIERGASKEVVYEGTRLLAAQPNRLFMDAFEPAQWRERGFYPVLNERQQTAAANTQASVMARMLTLKQQHPLPDSKILDEHLDVSLNRNQQCPTIEEFEHYAKTQPLAGMPYALPALSAEEHGILISWLAQGAIQPAKKVLPEQQLAVDELESFLNADNLKMRLSARYIYEHLFSTHLYFSALNEPGQQPQFYTLVRSKTPPGQTVEVIASRRPFSDPKVNRVYYRLQAVQSTIVNKTHQPYAINEDLLDKWQRWFVTAQYEVKKLPSYAPEVAANPLIAFVQLPVNARYRFMLERAENTIMGYIKGPVCRGQVALNVINDRFWVYFVKPELADSVDIERLYLSQQNNLRMPAEKESTALGLSWVEYAARHSEYIRARSDFMNKKFANGQHLTLDGIWQGDGDNTNASLTVFRHFDNATVVKGLIGKPPKTAWVIDYALLERIHYLLVAGFDVYGNYGHQLLTRLYMDFLRLEGETNFLALLPSETRHKEFKSWYLKAGPELTQFIDSDANMFKQASGISYSTDEPKKELYQMLQQHLSEVQPRDYQPQDSELSSNSKALLAKLGDIEGMSASIFPEITMIMVEPQHRSDAEIFTLIRNSEHFNVNSLFNEEGNRDKKHDDTTLVHGLLGSYPDAFWQVKEQDLAKLVNIAQQLKTQQDYTELLDQFGVRRTNPNFWSFSDKLNATFRRHKPIESGWLDYNRLENR